MRVLGVVCCGVHIRELLSLALSHASFAFTRPAAELPTGCSPIEHVLPEKNTHIQPIDDSRCETCTIIGSTALAVRASQ